MLLASRSPSRRSARSGVLDGCAYLRRCKLGSRPINVNRLLAAQRLWVQYRDANCAFYGTRNGSIRQVQAAERIRSMTEDRARELEEAIKLD